MYFFKLLLRKYKRTNYFGERYVFPREYYDKTEREREFSESIIDQDNT